MFQVPNSDLSLNYLNSLNKSSISGISDIKMDSWRKSAQKTIDNENSQQKSQLKP